MRRPNLALAGHLARAGWRPPQLVGCVNRLLGDGYLSRSTVSEWLHAGRIPREPLPAIIAQLLSEATGSPLSVRDLWPGAALAPRWIVPADDGLAHIAAVSCPAIALANDWIRHADHLSGRDRRHFTPVPRTTLPTGEHGRAPVNCASADSRYAPVRGTADHPINFPATRGALRFAHRHVLALAELLIDQSQDENLIAGLVLATAAAREAAHAVGEHGLTQRYEMSHDILRSARHNRHRTA